MVEGTPGKPYGGLMAHFNNVEANMAMRCAPPFMYIGCCGTVINSLVHKFLQSIKGLIPVDDELKFFSLFTIPIELCTLDIFKQWLDNRMYNNLRIEVRLPLLTTYSGTRKQLRPTKILFIGRKHSKQLKFLPSQILV